MLWLILWQYYFSLVFLYAYLSALDMSTVSTFTAVIYLLIFKMVSMHVLQPLFKWSCPSLSWCICVRGILLYQINSFNGPKFWNFSLTFCKFPLTLPSIFLTTPLVFHRHEGCSKRSLHTQNHLYCTSLISTKHVTKLITFNTWITSEAL